MSVLFSTGSLYGLPYHLAFRLASAAGCDGVELVLDPWSLMAGPNAVRQYGHRMACPIRALHPSLFGLPGWRTAPEAFPRLAEWALALECPLVVVHPPRFSGLAENIRLFDQGLASFRRVAGEEVVIGLENSAVFFERDRQHPYVWPERVAAFALERGMPVVFDTTHAASTGLGLVEAYDQVAGLVRHVHLSDFRQPHAWLDRPSLDTYFKHHQLPGEGELDLASFFRRLEEDGYSGAVTVEVSPVALRIWRPSLATQLLRHSVDMVRGWRAVGGQATPVLPLRDAAS
ncbi:MAG: sugar phosphate isomerase/epimerase [Anaerolineae bacterium]|nr:sugar phosphate isomerase/epimerase [Anaerolineae bacterium]